MDTINKIVEKMTDGDSQLGGDFFITLYGPIEWTSHNHDHARWYVYQADSIPDVISSLREFLNKWTIPFLEKYKAPSDICNAAIEGDHRDIHSQQEILRVVAAKVLCGRPEEAMTLMDRWFGRPGPRKRYRPVFNYLTALTCGNV